MRDELVERFLPLARSIAMRFAARSESFEDLQQVAAIGLIKALDRYDPSRGAFSSFAVPTISGEIKRYFRDRTWSVRPPRDLQELTLRVDKCAEKLARTLQRVPTVRELADEVGVDEEAILEARYARQAKTGASMQARIGGDSDAVTLEDLLGGEDRELAIAEERVVLDRLLNAVSERERRVLRMRFELDMTQAEIGEILGVSQMQISRIIRQAIARMQIVARAGERDEVAVAA